MTTNELSIEILRDTLESQKLAVLSTQKDGYPYANLVAVAYSNNYKSMVFVTDRNTRKFENMKSSSDVAILFDNRKTDAYDFDSVVAITAVGKAVESSEEETDYLKSIYIDRHPDLIAFINSPSSALMKVDVERYIIASFNSVSSFVANDIF